MNTNFKTFQSFLNKCKKSSLPVLHHMFVQYGKATISDLETWVQFWVDLPDGYYDIVNNETFLVSEADDKYPKPPKDELETGSMVINSSIIPKYAPFMANDETRPLVSSIHFDDEYICATDAYIMRFEKNYTDNITNGFEANVPASMALMARCKLTDEQIVATARGNISRTNGQVNKNKEGEDILNPANITFTFSDCTITVKLVEGKYPNFRAVIPDFNSRQSEMKCIRVSSDFVNEAAKTFKAFKAHRLTITDRRMSIQKPDSNVIKNWPAPEVVEYPDAKFAGILMPKGSNDDTADNVLGLDPLKLATWVTNYKGNVTIGYFPQEPGRAMAIWLEPANVKIEKAQPAPAQRKALPAPNPVPVPAPVDETDPVDEIDPIEPIPIPSPAPANKPKWVKKEEDNTPIEVVEYSDRALAVFGNTVHLKWKLHEIGGKFNRYLKHNNEPTPGWIFSKKRETALRQLLAS